MQPKLFFILLISCFLLQGSYAQTVSARAFFKTGSSKLSSSESLKIHIFIKSLDPLNISNIYVYAYCDDRGNEVYNQGLSIKRAEAVKIILYDLIPGNTIQVEGKENYH